MLASTLRILRNRSTLSLRYFAKDADAISARTIAKMEKIIKSENTEIIRSISQIQNDTWSLPLTIDNSKVMIRFNLDNPNNSYAFPLQKDRYITPGVYYHESINKLSKKDNIVYLPFLSTEIGDLHIFYTNCVDIYNIFIISNQAGINSDNTMYPYPLIKTESPFSTAFGVHNVIGASNNSHELAPLKYMLNVLKLHFEKIKNIEKPQIKTPKEAVIINDKKKKVASLTKYSSSNDGKTIYFHLADKITVEYMNKCLEPNADVSTFKRAKEEIEYMRNLSSTLGVTFKFLDAFGAESYSTGPRVPPPFGMRSMYQEYMITLQSVARKTRAAALKQTKSSEKLEL